jgi:hypothetical protein
MSPTALASSGAYSATLKMARTTSTPTSPISAQTSAVATPAAHSRSALTVTRVVGCPDAGGPEGYPGWP